MNALRIKLARWILGDAGIVFGAVPHGHYYGPDDFKPTSTTSTHNDEYTYIHGGSHVTNVHEHPHG